MIGGWIRTSRAVVCGAGGHCGDGDTEARFVEATLTIEWIEQDDDRLIGTIASAEDTEPRIGVSSSDGTALITADTDSSSAGRLIDDDHIELCYIRTSIADERMAVSCVEFERTQEKPARSMPFSSTVGEVQAFMQTRRPPQSSPGPRPTA